MGYINELDNSMKAITEKQRRKLQIKIMITTIKLTVVIIIPP